MQDKNKYYVEFVICSKDGTWIKRKYLVPEVVFMGSHADALDYCADKLQKYNSGSELVFINDYYMNSKKRMLQNG